MVRLTCDERTQTYVARRTVQGMAKRDIIRCLKRYVAREVYHALFAPHAPLWGLPRHRSIIHGPSSAPRGDPSKLSSAPRLTMSAMG